MLVVFDYFTKWTESFDVEARTVADIMLREVITRFCMPSTIHSNQGRQFEGHAFSETYKLLHLKETPYHPQSD